MYAWVPSTIYPDMRWQGRLLLVFAMLFVPKILLSRSQKSSFTLKKEVG